MKKLKKLFNFIFSRLFLVALMLVLQIALFVFLIVYSSQAVSAIYIMANIVSFIAVVGVVSNNENPSYKLTWIIAILVFPVVGGIFYFFFGNKRMSRKLRRQILLSMEDNHIYLSDNAVGERLQADDPHLALHSRYIYNISGYPTYYNTISEYYPVGELMFERIVEELKQAEKYIFLEYFIIRPGIMWNTIYDILREKVAQGVEIRLMYDDLGSISTVPKGFDRAVRAAGIKLCVFNPFRPRASVIHNNRDHRKICVIDGKIAFCGGINLADEYINQFERFGHWKDTGVMLQGEAVWSFVFMFLHLWKFSTGEKIMYNDYRVSCARQDADGLVQVFDDSPLDRHNVTETAYLNIIYRATKYVYITTPYLVIDNEMEFALCTAAEAGIDVRIITPYIPDKWYVHMLTRSHYKRLIQSGVKIYEYSPGFMHGKMFVSDDNVCLVGTCNMDFRSFYLHFECSVLFFGAKIIADVKADMLACQDISHLVTLEDADAISIPRRMLRAFLKIFAPLM